jgi:predicted RNA-binding protein with PIN domain
VGDALPEAALDALAGALGGYLGARARNELPGRLRRWHGFRLQTLLRHRDEVVASLDDPDVRAKVLEWLDDGGSSLPRASQEALRIACERADGWRDRLAAWARDGATGPARPRRPEVEALRERLEAEKVRARRAREEVRAAREQGRRRAEAERARALQLAREVRALETRLRRAGDAAEAARRSAEVGADDAAARLRRARRDVDRARAERDEARAELKAARRSAAQLSRRVAALQARVEGLEQRLSAAPRSGRSRRPAGSGAGSPRRPLPAPKGMLADDPDALSEWLADDDVVLLVDGYNVTKAPGGFAGLQLEAQRERLTEAVERLARRRAVRATIVFDGSRVPPGTARPRRGPVEVHYSRPHESADDHLIALLGGLPPDPVVVVSDDRELRARAAALGATLARSSQLLALIR